MSIVSKFNPKSPKGKVPNGQLKFLMCYAKDTMLIKKYCSCFKVQSSKDPLNPFRAASNLHRRKLIVTVSVPESGENNDKTNDDNEAPLSMNHKIQQGL